MRIVLCAVALCGCLIAEKRAVCFQGDEQLALTPTDAVTWDGFSLQRSTTTGTFQSDAGVEFDVNVSALAAVDPLDEACVNVARAVTLTVSDPFTGVTSTITATQP